MYYIQACNLAKEYFLKHLGSKGLAIVTENTKKWFFSPANNGSGVIGNVIISISKENGNIQLVDMLSDEGFEEVQCSTIIDIPLEFKA